MFSNKAIDSARTQGDGMENESLAAKANENNNKTAVSATSTNKIKLPNNIEIERLLSKPGSGPGASSIYRPSNSASTSLPATIPKGKIFNLVPKLVQSSRPASLRNKEPKFVPFEPYKGAVNPIIPYKNINKIKLIDKNNLDLNILVSQMSTVTTNELNQQNGPKNHEEFDSEKQKYETKIAELVKEKDYFQGQLKFQAQVNSELKNLLVAAVGEDLQTRVNVLTEDKLHLARQLLNSAENLSSHTEQIEFLAGQSEVWRSKFLASSLMVEELARWKTSLLQKNNLLLASNKQMLELFSKLREMESEILRNLKFLSNAKELGLKSCNVMDLTAECLNISQQLILQHSAIGMPEILNLQGLDCMTDAEKLAVQALQNSSQRLMSTDEAFKAIVGQAFPSIISMKQQEPDNPSSCSSDTVAKNDEEINFLAQEKIQDTNCVSQ